MTWSSTALYYDHINREIARRLGGLHSGRIAIESFDFDEIAAQEASGDWDGIGESLATAARNLEAGGADAIVIACNTVHKSCGPLEATLKIPFFHIADATADKLVADRCKRVALLGTRFTMTEPFFRSRLEGRGIDLPCRGIGQVQSVDHHWNRNNRICLIDGNGLDAIRAELGRGVLILAA